MDKDLYDVIDDDVINEAFFPDVQNCQIYLLVYTEIFFKLNQLALLEKINCYLFTNKTRYDKAYNFCSDRLFFW